MENTGIDMAITIPDTPDRSVRRIKVKRTRQFQEIGEKPECSDTRTENGHRSEGNALFKKKDKGKSISTDPCMAHVAASRESSTSSSKGKEKAVDLSCDRQENRGTKRRMVVRHGCISLHGIAARAGQATDTNSKETVSVEEKLAPETTSSSDIHGKARGKRSQIGCTTAGGSNESEVTAIRSSEEPSSSRPPRIQNHQRQIEADELLARELQEELYKEEMLIRHEQMDENIARLLEQEEIALRPSSSSSSSSARLFHRNSHTRFYYLEEEVENDIGHSITNMGRTEERYELLIAPVSFRHGGASTQRINNLPESTVQTDIFFQEPCAICLETPTIGDTIRHLPCLHKFHKECIDPWLGQSMLCPLCKSSINST